MFTRRLARLALGICLVFSFLILPRLFAKAATSNKKIVITFADFSERSGLVFVAKDQGFPRHAILPCAASRKFLWSSVDGKSLAERLPSDNSKCMIY